MKTIAFLSNQGGVGTTSLVYHLAWMYADLGLNVLVADLDPQANLTSMFVDEGRLATLLPEAAHHQTIFGSIRPLLASRSSDGTGDISPPHVEDVVDNIGLLVGDLAMSAYEDELHNQWHNCLDRQPRAFAVLSAFWQVMEQTGSSESDSESWPTFSRRTSAAASPMFALMRAPPARDSLESTRKGREASCFSPSQP